MIYYHGTDATSALTIASHKIDVTKGGGELGQGFYVGSLLHKAFAWAYNKSSKQKGKVVEFNINDDDFLQVQRIWLEKGGNN